jgi:TonB family protein
MVLTMCTLPLLYIVAAVQLAPAQQTQPPGDGVQFVGGITYDLERGIYVNSAPLAAVMQRTTPPAAPGGIKPPVLLYMKEPQYTEAALKAQQQGLVVLSLAIGADGQARVITVLKSLGLGLDQNTVAAVEQWKFKPATQNGVAVDYPATVTMSFRLLSAPAQQAQAAEKRAIFRATTTLDVARGTYVDTAREPGSALETQVSPTLSAPPSGVQPPVLLYKKEPEYSEEARAAKYQGSVTLLLTVGTDGRAGNIKVLRPLSLGLDEKAMEAVGQWRFKPATQDGQPVEYNTTVEVTFRLLNSIAVPAENMAALQNAVPCCATSGSDGPKPVLLYKKEPEYTTEARGAKLQGTVMLLITVGTDGRAGNMKVLRSLGLGLDEKAIEAVKQWKFKPAMQDGEPIEVATTVLVNFRLL